MALEEGKTSKTTSGKVGAFNVGEGASNSWRERLLEERAGGTIYRDVGDVRPTELSKRGVQPRQLNAWQTGEDGRYQGAEIEQFPKELPDGAIDWDPNGNPYYGGRTPFQEWQLRAHANLERKTQITEEQASWDDWEAPKISEQEGIKEKGKAVLAGAFELYEQTSESVDWILAGGDEEVNRLQTGWRQMSHYAGETLQRLGSVAYQTKLFFGGMAHLAEEAFQIGAGVDDDPVHFTDRWKEINDASDQFTVAPAQNDLFWRKIGVSQNTIDEYKMGALAGRMFYTSIWDNTVDRVKGISGTGQAGNLKKEEFLREMKENPNANPNVMVKKYENPAAEMWGEIIFDPLNVFEWGAKAAKSGIMVAKATKLFADPMTAVGTFLKGSDVTRVSGLLDDAQDAAKLAGLVDARITDVAKVAAADTKLAKSKSIIGLTNSAKAHVAAQDIGQVTQWAWRQSKLADGTYDVERLMEIQEAIIRTAGDADYLKAVREGAEITTEMAEKNKATIIEGLEELSRYPGYDIAFTEPGTRSALMMQDMWSAGKVEKLRKTLTSSDDHLKGLKAAVEYSDEVIEASTKKFFPDMVDEAYEATGGWKVLAKTNKFMQDGPYKFFNSFFSSIYLGLNPGFAARNFMQNTVQALMDEGVRGVVGFNSLDNIVAWGADITPLGAVTEFGSVAAGERNVAKWTRSKLFVGTEWAAKGEKFAGIKIYGRVYPQTMKKLLRKGLSYKELRKFGVDKDMADNLLQKVIDNKGDYNKVFDDLIVDAERGFYEVGHSSLSWSDDMVKWADDTGFDNPILQAMQTSQSKDDAVNQVRKMFQDLWDEGEKVVDDIPVLKAEDVAAEEMATRAHHIDMYGGKEMMKDQLELNHYFGVNTEVWTSGKQVSTNYKTNLASQLVADGHFASAQEANSFLESALRGINIDGTDVEITRLFGTEPELAKVVRLKDSFTRAAAHDTQVALNAKEVDMAALWSKWELDKVHGKMPSGITKPDMRAHIWEAQRRKTRPLYESYRDTAAAGYKQTVDVWKQAADTLGLKNGIEYPAAEIKQLESRWNKAKMFDNFLDSRDVGRPLARALNEGDMQGVAVQYARMFGISTSTEAGLPLDDKLVNILNSQLKRKFTDLSDLKGAVGPEEIELALLSHAVGETIGIYETAGAEGFAALKRLVVTHTLDIPADDMMLIDQTLDVLRQVDEDLAKNIELLYKQRNYQMGEVTRKGRRMSELTRAEADNVVGEMQAKLDDLIDEAGQKLEQAGAIEPPKYLDKMDDAAALSDQEVDEILLALEDNVDLRKKWGQSQVARKGEGRLEDITEIPGGDEAAQAAATAKAQAKIAKVEGEYQAVTKEVREYLGENPELRNIAEEAVEARRTRLEEAGVFKSDMAYYSGENVATTGRQAYELRGNLRNMEQQFVDMVNNTWGKTQPIQESAQQMKNLGKMRKHVGNLVEESRQISNKVALNKRNFILHDYAKKRNFDLAMSYVMPYHFWYNRTYAAWLQRTVTHPGTITAYLDYKDMLGKIHADMPDWWKHNLNTNELLGIDSENPFYFQLEAALSPLNGLTGVDFDDKDKGFSWFSSMMQDVGKYGPSVYTPIAWGIALDAYRRGEKEATAKWAGRSIPQTQVFKAVTAMMGLGAGKSGIELDPAIWLTSGGLDIYESRRVGRALGWAVDNGMLTEEQAQQAAMEGPGNEMFDNARGIAQGKRSGGQLTSFAFGVGLKARSKEDLEIDMMDAEYSRFRQQREDMSTEQITAAYRYFSEKYSFFNTLQIARRDEDERDTSYAYSVLARIPPGQTKEAYRAMGLERKQVDEFWEEKKIPESWTERERVNFVSAIQDVGIMLAIPKDATKDEWIDVKDRSKKLYANAETEFGVEVVELVDSYWLLYGSDPEAAKRLREVNPIIENYQDYLTMGKVNDPLLAKYYASYDQLRMMVTGMTYDKLDETYGADFHQMYAEYNELRLINPKAAKSFYKAHPEIKAYKTEKTYLKALNSERLIAFADRLPARTPSPVFREDIPEDITEAQAAVAQGFDQPNVPEYYEFQREDWAAFMTPALESLVVDWATRNEELSYTAEQSLEYQLRDLDININLAKQLIRAAYQGRRAVP